VCVVRQGSARASVSETSSVDLSNDLVELLSVDDTLARIDDVLEDYAAVTGRLAVASSTSAAVPVRSPSHIPCMRGDNELPCDVAVLRCSCSSSDRR
jgi:hypothetical protein